MKRTENEKCANCRWFAPQKPWNTEQSEFGSCHYNPPADSIFPVVEEGEFCSKFESTTEIPV